MTAMRESPLPSADAPTPPHADNPLCRPWLLGYITQDKPRVAHVAHVAHVTAVNQARKTAIKASNACLSTPIHLQGGTPAR